MSEEVKLHCPSRKDGVVTVTMNLALEAQPPKKGQRVIHGPTGQYWNSNVGLLHDVFDVSCRLTFVLRRGGPSASSMQEKRKPAAASGTVVRRRSCFHIASTSQLFGG